MTYEQINLYLTVAVLAVGVWNAYTSAAIKLWVTQNFVSKADFLSLLPFMQDSKEGKAK